jgi:hypothetical protein
MPGRQRRPGSAAVVRTSLLASQDLLGGGQPGGSDPSPARVGQVLAVGGCGEAGDPNIDTDRSPGGHQGPGGDTVAGQDKHPAAPFATNLDGLDPPLDPAMDGDLHLPDPLQVHPSGIGQPSTAVTVLRPGNTVEPVRRLEPRVARRLAHLHPPKEGSEGPVQAAQGRLLGRERPQRNIRPEPSDLFELGRLVPIGDTDSPTPPRVASFLQGSVVQLAVRRHTLAQGDMLTSGGAQPELIGPSHAASDPKWTSTIAKRPYPRGMTRRAAILGPTDQAPEPLTIQAVTSLLGGV